MSNITLEVEKITPQIAAEWLKTNKGNRNASENNVNFLAREITTGNWRVTGDTIKISKTGKLKDGQHRLLAVIKSGRAVNMGVARGVDDDVFEVLDTGRSRKASDVLSIDGFSHAATMSAAIRWILLYKANRLNLSIVGGGGIGGGMKFSNTEIRNFAQKHRELSEIITHCHNQVYLHFRSIAASPLSAMYYLMSRKNQVKCDEFFDRYANGTNLSENSPIRLLRQRLITDVNNQTRLSALQKSALMVEAWNYFLGNKRPERLILPKQFPKIY